MAVSHRIRRQFNRRRFLLCGRGLRLPPVDGAANGNTAGCRQKRADQQIAHGADAPALFPNGQYQFRGGRRLLLRGSALALLLFLLLLRLPGVLPLCLPERFLPLLLLALQFLLRLLQPLLLFLPLGVGGGFQIGIRSRLAVPVPPDIVIPGILAVGLRQRFLLGGILRGFVLRSAFLLRFRFGRLLHRRSSGPLRIFKRAELPSACLGQGRQHPDAHRAQQRRYPTQPLHSLPSFL